MTDNKPQQDLVRLISEPINRSLARASTPAGALRETITVLAYIGLIFGFWAYSNKFLGMSADYITSMSRDISVLGILCRNGHINMKDTYLDIEYCKAFCSLKLWFSLPRCKNIAHVKSE